MVGAKQVENFSLRHRILGCAYRTHVATEVPIDVLPDHTLQARAFRQGPVGEVSRPGLACVFAPLYFPFFDCMRVSEGCA